MTGDLPFGPIASGVKHPSLLAVPVGPSQPPGSASLPRQPEPPGEALIDRPDLADSEACPLCGLDPCGCGELLIDGGESLDDPSPELALYEWPIACRRPPGPLAVWRTRRANLLAAHGERACVSPTHPAGQIARDARERMQAVEERLGMRPPSAEQVAIARATLETVGALLLSLWEKLEGDRH